MSASSFEDGGEDEQIRSKIDEQVRWYMRERYACRLKLCAVAQLVGSGAYGFGPRLLPSYAFGLLCAAGGALAFGAAHTCRRPLLLSHCAACVAVLLSAAPVVGALRGLVPPDHVAHPKSSVHGRLLLYACLTALHALLQLPALYAGAAILWWPATSATSELGGILSSDAMEELLHVDLARAPPLKLAGGADEEDAVGGAPSAYSPIGTLAERKVT